MSWPSPTDYQEALQNPVGTFSDLQLRQSQVEFDKLGLPRPVSGNFATVFELTYAGKSWAIRCFLREVKDQKSRYDTISRHLKLHPLPYMVEFQYLPQGIRIKGQLYPIVKMEWIRGRRLDSYIQENLFRPQKLQSLAANWQKLVLELRQASIAHGDLQHGNIVITNNDEIKLIDYDGMFVPALGNVPTNEVGHRNYQHPSRTSDKDVYSNNFTNVDNFSAWVIGLSIKMLEIDPALWAKTQAGDDCLLFKAEDFKNPSSSQTLHLLSTHSNQQIRQYSQNLIAILKKSSYLDVPVMDLGITPISKSNPANRNNWFKDHLPSSHRSTRLSDSWIKDHIEPEKPLPKFEFPIEFLLEEKELLENEFRNMSFSERSKRFFFTFGRYLENQVKEKFANYPIVVEKRKAYAAYKRLEQDKALIELDLRAREVDYQKAYKITEEKHNLEFQKRQSESRLQEIENAFRLIQTQEENEIAHVRQDYLHTNLKFCVLRPGMVRGIGKVRIDTLNRLGIYSALDISPSRKNQVIYAFDGIYNSAPEDEWNSLVQWRTVLETQYSNNSGLISSVRGIQNKFAIKRSSFEGEKRQKIAEASNTQRRLNQLSQQSLTQLEMLVQESKTKISELDEKIDKMRRYCARYSQITETKLIEQLRKV